MVPLGSQRLYQQLAADFKRRLERGTYAVGEKLPAERLIAEEMNVSRTVVREAIIMLEVEGYVEVRKGSGIHVVSQQQRNVVNPDGRLEFASFGPFELLQARQLIESNIAEFAATQVTPQDILQLMAIQQEARKEDRFRDSEWDLKFHVQIARATQNGALAEIVEKMWLHRQYNPYWLKLHEHIEDSAMESWCDDHERILKALIRKDPAASKLAMWQHLEHTRKMLFAATSDDFDTGIDRYMFSENPVIALKSLSEQDN
ncbi:transcriptional regulator ExuR [Kalamiella sp. sgz302252]|uniref:transcriptional regulator ExuR n=1 Tax=Pantoea sp. sgz302252 TaxID=3341827 RepID=UPI0036D25003